MLLLLVVVTTQPPTVVTTQPPIVAVTERSGSNNTVEPSVLTASASALPTEIPSVNSDGPIVVTTQPPIVAVTEGSGSNYTVEPSVLTASASAALPTELPSVDSDGPVTVTTTEETPSVLTTSTSSTLTVPTECRVGSHQCSTRAHCISTGNSYICTCHDGFRSSGFICTGMFLYIPSFVWYCDKVTVEFILYVQTLTSAGKGHIRAVLLPLASILKALINVQKIQLLGN